MEEVAAPQPRRQRHGLDVARREQLVGPLQRAPGVDDQAHAIDEEPLGAVFGGDEAARPHQLGEEPRGRDPMDEHGRRAGARLGALGEPAGAVTGATLPPLQEATATAARRAGAQSLGRTEPDATAPGSKLPLRSCRANLRDKNDPDDQGRCGGRCDGRGWPRDVAHPGGQAFPHEDVIALASARSVGARIPFRGGELEVQLATPEAFAGVDIALFSAGAAASRELGPAAADARRW